MLFLNSNAIAEECNTCRNDISTIKKYEGVGKLSDSVEYALEHRHYKEISGEVLYNEHKGKIEFIIGMDNNRRRRKNF